MNFLRSITTVFQLYVLNAKLTYIVECLRINDRRVREAEASFPDFLRKMDKASFYVLK